jgi:hypothetical protein
MHKNSQYDYTLQHISLVIIYGEQLSMARKISSPLLSSYIIYIPFYSNMIKCCMVCQIRLTGTVTDIGKLDLFDLQNNIYI